MELQDSTIPSWHKWQCFWLGLQHDWFILVCQLGHTTDPYQHLFFFNSFWSL